MIPVSKSTASVYSRVAQAAEDAGIKYPKRFYDEELGEIVVVGDDGMIYRITLQATGRQFTPSFDQNIALREGWCIIESQCGTKSIQANDESSAFECDLDAQEHVTRLAEAGSVYHTLAVHYVENHNAKTKERQRKTQ